MAEDILQQNDENALQRQVYELECALAKRDEQLDIYTKLVGEIRHLIPPYIYNVFIEEIQRVCPLKEK